MHPSELCGTWQLFGDVSRRVVAERVDFEKLSGFFKLIHTEFASCGASTLIRRGRLIYRDVATSSSGLHNFCEHRELGTSLQGEPGALLYS